MTAASDDLSTIELSAVRDRIGATVELQTIRLATQLVGLSPDLTAMGQALVDFCRGGKRIRPLFAYCGWRAAGASATVREEAVITAISALELVQAAALIHDDIIDESDSRRGAPSAHAAFAAAHHDAQMLGDSAKHGTSAAILLGDIALVWADQLLHSADLPLDVLADVRREFDRMRIEVLAGQYLDVLQQSRPGRHEEAMGLALRVAELKSASYTVARPMRIGALMAHADDDVLDAFERYGHHLGIAFQLRDDLLGVYGMPEQTGKPAGDDLREGKRTALVACAHERLAGTDSERLLDEIGSADLTDARIAEIAAVLQDCGAVDDVEVLIAEHATAAHDAVIAADLEPAGRDALIQMIELATTRSH